MFTSDISEEYKSHSDPVNMIPYLLIKYIKSSTITNERINVIIYCTKINNYLSLLIFTQILLHNFRLNES